MPIPGIAAAGIYHGGRAAIHMLRGKHKAVHHVRHRRGLTAKRKADLLWLKANVGKTAAAQYLAHHMP